MKINKRNYYGKNANAEYMSFSQFKDFMKCPAMAVAKINGTYNPVSSDSMLVGSYVDSWLDGELDRFVTENPEMFTKQGELKAPFRKADELCKIIQDDEYLYGKLKGNRQKIVTGIISGVPFKGKIDSLLPDEIVDGKVLKDCNDVWLDGERKPFYMANRYDIQAFIYTELYRQMTGKKLPFTLAVVTKEATPDKRLIRINDTALQTAEDYVREYATVFNDIKHGKIKAVGCGKCPYCLSIKKLNVESYEIL